MITTGVSGAMLKLWILFCLISSVSTLNVLMYALLVGKSHFQYSNSLIKVLTENGHTVDIIYGQLNSLVNTKGDHGTRNAVTVSFDGVSPWVSASDHLLNPFEEPPSWNPFAEPFPVFDKTTDQLCDLVLDSSDVHDLLTANKYDIALVSGYEFCPYIVMHQYKIFPVVSYSPTPAAALQNYYAGLPELPIYENNVLDTRIGGDRSTFGSRIIENLRVLKEHYGHIEIYTRMNNKARSRYGSNFPDVRDLVKNVSLDFSNSNPILEEPKPISYRARYIGGVGMPKPKPISKELDRILNLSKKGSVIFSFGTQIPADKISEEHMRVFTESFKRFPDYNFLWKHDGKRVMNATNIFNIEWLPQTDLLYDHRVVGFISHMGLNSFTETAFAGVPVVSIPLFADQVHNARRAMTIGIGTMIRKTEITIENLSDALQKILHDPSYRQRALEISSMLQTNPDNAVRVFVEGIEFAAKHKTLPDRFRLMGADRSFFVQLGWDVAAFFTTSIIFFLYSGFRIANLLIKFIRRNNPIRIMKTKSE